MSRSALKIFTTLLAVACFAAASPARLVVVITAEAAARQATNARGIASVARHAQTTSGDVKEAGRVSARLERGGRVAVDNRTRGRIRVVGWDRNTIEATAISERGFEAVKIRIDEASGGRLISLDTDYADEGRFTLVKRGELRGVLDKHSNVIIKSPRPMEGGLGPGKPRLPLPRIISAAPSQPAPPQQPQPQPQPQPTPTPSEPASPSPEVSPTGAGEESSDLVKLVTRPVEIHLEVHVPRYAEIETIKVIRSPVEVSGVETDVRVSGDKGEVKLEAVGGTEVRTTSGGVSVEGARGFVDVVTFGGPVRVRNSRGDVRARSIDGRIDIECGRGRVDVTSAGGHVSLSAVGGDVDANTTSGDISYAGAIRREGRYYLKSMTGRVEMSVGGQPPGFTAALSSYRGTINSDFSLKIKEDAPGDASVSRRRVGRHGDGGAQLTLDSFEGEVRLSKAAPSAMIECRQ